MIKIDKIKIRTEKTNNDYISFLKKVENKEEILDFDDNHLSKKAIKSFKYWFIIDNRFPYDAVAVTSHILLPKRKVEFDWDLLTEEELLELKQIKKKYLSENYEVIWESLPKSPSIKQWFHIHLINLIRR